MDSVHRFEEHKQTASRREKSRLYNSMNAHGIDSFELRLVEELGEVTDQVANAREMFWISEMNTMMPNGYNMTLGGEGARGCKQTEGSKKKRSISLKLSYKEGRAKSWFSTADKSFFQKHYKSEILANGRRNSKKWKESVTSSDYRKLKSERDPRSRKVTINGVEYTSIRYAAKMIGIPYSRLRTILNGKNLFSF